MEKVLLMKEFETLKDKFENLSISEIANNAHKIDGNLGFCANVKGEEIKEDYEINTIISPKYPRILPATYEVGEKLDKSFHINPDDTLCLGTPLEMKINFAEQPNLLGYFENLVIPFFLTAKLASMGRQVEQHVHGGVGILKFYCQLFGITDMFKAKSFLRLLAKGKCSRKKQCPCNSGRRLKNCHGELVWSLQKYQTPEEFQYELSQTK